mmetsp:Transcript_41360/g.98925  ORF Transcript_41360/g.98925 Transcript_41360/m.98925 type:complete len:209 (+) Transcript_41360:1849-2475(+)
MDATAGLQRLVPQLRQACTGVSPRSRHVPMRQLGWVQRPLVVRRPAGPGLRGVNQRLLPSLIQRHLRSTAQGWCTRVPVTRCTRPLALLWVSRVLGAVSDPCRRGVYPLQASWAVLPVESSSRSSATRRVTMRTTKTAKLGRVLPQGRRDPAQAVLLDCCRLPLLCSPPRLWSGSARVRWISAEWALAVRQGSALRLKRPYLMLGPCP